MKNFLNILILFAAVAIIPAAPGAEEQDRIEVFHKTREPAMKTLERVKPVIEKYERDYRIYYHVITDPENEELISKYNLPGTHFPFAVVINGRFSAKIDDQKIDFVHFPLFMHGIGRHEGNWSLETLEQVLRDNSLLIKENILPELEDEEDQHECEEQ
jgi:hypothetical protein